MDLSTKLRSKHKATCLPSDPDQKQCLETEQQSSRLWSIRKDGFPPGMTVDELKKYRRKQPSNRNRPVDNLYLEEGSYKPFKTEYNRRFRAPPLESLTNQRNWSPINLQKSQIVNDAKLELSLGECEKSLDFPKVRPRGNRPNSQLDFLNANVPMTLTTEKLEKYTAFPNAEKSRPLRRSTALKPEGEMLTETEFQREFHAHGSLDRVQAIRRPTYLKLDGLFESLTTEQQEKYKSYINSQRPPLTKRPTELKLNGELDFATECHDKYVYPGLHPRPVLRKRSTSLKLDGEVDFMPEYRRSFVYCPRSRPSMAYPNNNLNSEGELDFDTEFRSQFLQYLPISSFMRPVSAKSKSSLLLEGDHSLNPEYREKFINFGVTKSDINRTQDNLNLEGNFSYETENSKYRYVPSFAHEKRNNSAKKSSEKIINGNSTLPKSEYLTEFLDFPRQRPQISKPSSQLQNSAIVGEITEGQSENHQSLTVPRTKPHRRPANLQPVGGIEGEPEYKNKFVEFPVSYHRRAKPTDSLSREYASFHVLDVEPQAAEPTEPLPVSSLPANSELSFRLEVSNAGSKPTEFHQSPVRIFPSEAIPSKPFCTRDNHEMALEAATKRKLSFERKTASKGQCTVDFPSKLLLDENGNQRAFAVLDKSHGTEDSSKRQLLPPALPLPTLSQSLIT